MNNTLASLCIALKKLLSTLHPSQKAYPLIFIMGPKHSGKSSILKQSTLEAFPFSHEEDLALYYNAQGIYLELNERILFEHHTLLSTFFKTIRNIDRRLYLASLLYTLPIRDLYSAPLETLKQTIKHTLQDLRLFSEAFGKRIPIGLVLTQADMLPGFYDFFQHTHHAERSEPLGFSIEWGHLPHQTKPGHNFKSQFDHFVRSVDQQVISNMHAIRSNIKRSLIREFPCHLLNLRYALLYFFDHTEHLYYQIQGLYFTSAEQQGYLHDPLDQKISSSFALSVRYATQCANNHRAYFIDGALQHFQSLSTRPVLITPLRQRLKILGFASLLGFCLAGIAHQYATAKSTLNHVSKILLEYDQNPASQTLAIPSLYRLSEAKKMMQGYASNVLSDHESAMLTTRLQNLSTQQIRTTLIARLIHDLEQTLTAPQTLPAERYEALKMYRSLYEVHQRHPDELIHWFEHYETNQTPSITEASSLLRTFFHEQNTPLSINQNLVHDVQVYLKALPEDYFYYQLLKSHFPQKTLAFEIPHFQYAWHQIPVYYTKDGFNTITHHLPEYIQSIQKESWVLNQNPPSTLYETLLKTYSYDYALWWKNLMHSIAFIPESPYQKTRQAIHHLTKTHAIQTLIQRIQHETKPDFNDPNSVFNHRVATPFATLNLISPSHIHDIEQTLKELEPFLRTLEIVKDDGHTAFLITKSRFDHQVQANALNLLYQQTQQFPEPIHHWLQSIADHVWYLLMNDTQHYINQQWQTLVYQPYQQTIADHYPFQPNSTQAISIQAFNHFFSKEGILQDFFSTYLKSFIDTSNAAWKPQSVNHYQLALSEATLQSLMQANVITTMFFSEQSQQAHVRFKLERIVLDPTIQRLDLSLGHHAFTDTSRTTSSTTFEWPSTQATLNLSSIEGQTYTLHEDGPWAFFKMLEKLNVIPHEHEPHALEVLFEINGYTGRYLLKTNAPLNPFTPNIFNGFILGTTLTG